MVNSQKLKSSKPARPKSDLLSVDSIMRQSKGKSLTQMPGIKSASYLVITALLARQKLILQSYGAHKISGERKVENLLLAGFLTESKDGKQLVVTETGKQFAAGDIEYPSTAVAKAKKIACSEFYISSDLARAFTSLGVSKEYVNWFKKLSGNGSIPGGVVMHKPHLELFIARIKWQDWWRELSKVPDYYFGISHRSGLNGQQGIVIVGAFSPPEP